MEELNLKAVIYVLAFGNKSLMKKNEVH